MSCPPHAISTMAKPPPVCGDWKWTCACANCGARGCQWSCRVQTTRWLISTLCCPEVAYGGTDDRAGLLVRADDAALVAVSTPLLSGSRRHRPGDADRGAGCVWL